MLRYTCALVTCILIPGIFSAAEWKPVDVLINDVSTSGITKLSNDGMPDDLHVQIYGSGSDVKLRLKRSMRTEELPVYLIRNGVANKVDLPSVENAANYIDINAQSSMILRRIGNMHFTLDGMFVTGSNETLVLSDDNGTYIKDQEVNYNNDYIVRTDLNTSNTSRVRRQAGIEHTVEVLFVSDYKDFNTFVKKNDNVTMAESEMRLYYSFIADSMMLRYKTLSEGPNGDPILRVRLLVSGLLIIDNPRTSSFTSGSGMSEKVIAAKALDDFSDWIKRQRGLPPSDHQMLFTGYNLVRRDGSESVAGLAVLGGLCSSMAVSVVEQSNSGSIGATAAHELAHSLGARHDGEELGCTDSDNYIMSAKLGNPPTDFLASRPWQFSKCSVRRIKNFLRRKPAAATKATLSDTQLHLALKVTCTLKDSFYKSVIHTPYGVYPGQVYKADVQCRMALGDESYYGRYIQYRKGLDTMCRAMYCFLPGSRTTYRSVFAFEKTSCGDGKWCEKGRCVHSKHAPRTAENCPQGDDPNSDCSVNMCRHFTTKSAMASTCCGTCGTVAVVLQPQRGEAKKPTNNPLEKSNPEVVKPAQTSDPSTKPDRKLPESEIGATVNRNMNRNRFEWNIVRPGVSGSVIRPLSSSGTTFWDKILANIGRNLFRNSGSTSRNSRPNFPGNSGLNSWSSVSSNQGTKTSRSSSSSSSSSFRVSGSHSQTSNSGSRVFSSRTWKFPGSIGFTIRSPRVSSQRRLSMLRRAKPHITSSSGNQSVISRILSSVLGGTDGVFSIFAGPSSARSVSSVQGSKKTRRSLGRRPLIRIPWIFSK